MKPFGKSVRCRFVRAIAAAALITVMDSFAAPALDAPSTAFIKEHCLRCHGPEKTKGDLRLDQFGHGFLQAQHLRAVARDQPARAVGRDATKEGAASETGAGGAHPALTNSRAARTDGGEAVCFWTTSTALRCKPLTELPQGLGKGGPRHFRSIR